jgi:hypothetical protein
MQARIQKIWKIKDSVLPSSATSHPQQTPDFHLNSTYFYLMAADELGKPFYSLFGHPAPNK